MRGLFRPALFWVARIGLVLAVLAWIITQKWSLQVSESQIVDRGVVTVLPWSARHVTSFGIGPRQDSRFLRVAFGEEQPPQPPGDKVSPFTKIVAFAGFRAVSETRPRSTAMMISIRHWLVVATFALFYVVLKWVYRKREVPGE